VDQPNAAAIFLRRVPQLLRAAGGDRDQAHGARRRRPPLRRITYRTTLSARAVARLMDRLDCDRAGNSRRTGAPAWPHGWPLAHEVAEHLGADVYLVHVLAAWLERRSATSRRTYAYQVHAILRDLRVHRVQDLAALPHEAALTWQRGRAVEVIRTGQPRRPRTVNVATAVLNSLCGFVATLGLGRDRWVSIPPLPVNRGRHLDEEAVVLDPEQLRDFWALASRRPRRQFLALLIASLHGLRVAEVAGLRWRDLRCRRRGARPAPAVLHVIGKGAKHRPVHVHPALRGWLERARAGQDPEAFILADDDGRAPTPGQVSYWAKAVFRWMDLPTGYAHALRATWATLALENRRNAALQVQLSGGWSNHATMRERYFKRRQVPLVRLFGDHA
jgi:integrase